MEITLDALCYATAHVRVVPSSSELETVENEKLSVPTLGGWRSLCCSLSRTSDVELLVLQHMHSATPNILFKLRQSKVAQSCVLCRELHDLHIVTGIAFSCSGENLTMSLSSLTRFCPLRTGMRVQRGQRSRRQSTTLVSACFAHPLLLQRVHGTSSTKPRLTYARSTCLPRRETSESATNRTSGPTVFPRA